MLNFDDFEFDFEEEVVEKKNLTKIIVAVVAAIFLSFQISPVISQTVYDGFVEKEIVATLEEQISENVDALSVTEKANAVLDSIPDFAVINPVGITIAPFPLSFIEFITCWIKQV